MTDSNNQINYWDQIAWNKEFTLSINLPLLQKHLPFDSWILDYGCGYGRVCHELTHAGYRNVIGVDASAEMIRRGRQQYPTLRLEALTTLPNRWPVKTFDAILLVAVLTCIPDNAEQERLLERLATLLRPGGLIYISDFLLQMDERNRQRYAQHVAEYGTYGVFRLPEGVVLRHHAFERVAQLTERFDQLHTAYPEVVTMNGNEAKAFQYLGQRRSE